MGKYVKIVVVAIMAITSVATYATQSYIVIADKIASQQTNPSRMAISLTLFQNLMYKSPSEIIKYLKQQGCSVKHIPEQSLYVANAKGGYMCVFMKKEHIFGVGPIAFITTDKNINEAWVKSFKKQGFEKISAEVGLGLQVIGRCFA